MEYIIVQAGGKGSRLGYLTHNKPKALVPVENLPMLFHLFRKYPDKRFIIIADYYKEVLRAYLSVFAEVTFQIIDAEGTGTCAGIKQALKLIPENTPFMLIWSDLILPEEFNLPVQYVDEKMAIDDYIGISTTFPCRWSYQNENFVEESSSLHGVAGFFLFTDKKKIEEVPPNGELVRWMQENRMRFKEISLAGTKEFGLLEEYEKLGKEKCRPFNHIYINGNVLVKEPVDSQGKTLAERECAWYEKAQQYNISIIPKIYGKKPLEMELIKGKNIYEYNLPYDEKKEILSKIISALHLLHQARQIPTDFFSIKEAYYEKTMDRLSRIRDLVPFSNEREIWINGKRCRNIYYHKRELERCFDQLECKQFYFIHGDCTFSNLMLREDGTPVLIDPRGYFGHTEFYGDIRYDWAKLYYSIVGNYDQFNLKNFRLEIKEDGVLLQICSNHWEDMEHDFFELTGSDPYEIRLIHAVIWLSLTTYAWQDYDSVCGAFYNGLYYLEDIL